MLIPENDFVALFSQFSFDDLYQVIFGADAYDGNHCYNKMCFPMNFFVLNYELVTK